MPLSNERKHKQTVFNCIYSPKMSVLFNCKGCAKYERGMILIYDHPRRIDTMFSEITGIQVTKFIKKLIKIKTNSGVLGEFRRLLVLGLL